MRAPEDRPVLGILGGMGALASAQFLSSIHESSTAISEQSAPIVAVHADPAFPDRTTAASLLAGPHDGGPAPMSRAGSVARIDDQSELLAGSIVDYE